MTEEKQTELLAKVTQANQAATGNAPVAAKTFTINAMIEKMRPEFAKALAATIDTDRFCRILITEVRQSKALTQIMLNNPQSLIGACMEMAQLGLDPSVPNEAFLVPYGQEAACIIGYKGLMKLAIESAQSTGAKLSQLSTNVICENDIYEREMGTDSSVKHQPPKFGSDRGKVIGYVAIAKDLNGRINFVEMTVKEVQEHKARYSKAKYGPFSETHNFDAYGLKTVLRRLINRYLPMGAKLARAIDLENDNPKSPAIEQQQLPDLEVTTEN
jgi:recombination protein RecT